MDSIVSPTKLKSSVQTPKRPMAKRHVSESRVETLFDHIPQSVPSSILFSPENDLSHIHPLFYTLGLKYSANLIRGSNQRTISLLKTISAFLEVFESDKSKDFRRDFETTLQKNLKFLQNARPFAVAMENAIESFKARCRAYEGGVEEEEGVKKELREYLAEYLEGIQKAKEAIIVFAQDKIKEGDVVLIYGYSELITEIIESASKKPRHFSLIIIGDRPLANEAKGQGLQILNSINKSIDSTHKSTNLDKDSINLGTVNSISSITYSSLTGLSNVIVSVTKVFLGAHALLANGGVLAHVGTSQIALMATANNIPVLVCCETYKFCDKSPTDSFFYNEMGSGFGIEPRDGDDEGSEVKNLLTPLIKYDVTPPELVTAVITDVDILPSTSVPVVLRVQENRQLTSSLKNNS